MRPLDQWLIISIDLLLERLLKFFIEEIFLLYPGRYLLEGIKLDQPRSIPLPYRLYLDYLLHMRLKQGGQLLLLQGLQLRNGLVLEGEAEALRLASRQGSHTRCRLVFNQQGLEVVLGYGHRELGGLLFAPAATLVAAETILAALR